jgi:uncharacterized protein DUF6378
MATKEQRLGRIAFDTRQPGVTHMAEANNLVNGDRQSAYGSPLPSYEAQAKVWSGLLADKLKEDLTAEDVVLLLAGMKLRRQAHKPKKDNVVDVHGYMLVLSHVEEGRKSIPHIETTDHRG